MKYNAALALFSAFLAALVSVSCVSAPPQTGNSSIDLPQAGLPASESAPPQTGGSATDVTHVELPASGPGQPQSGSSTADLPHAEPFASESNQFKTGLPAGFDLAAVPAFSGRAWADVNDDVPYFTEKGMEAARRMVEEGGSFQLYGELDGLGRCTGACALVGPKTLPGEGRGSIGMVKPTGWHTVKYDGIDGNYLYNRCHLIGFQLTGQNANEKNLITGTRYMNVEGMLPYEDSVLAYVQGTAKHVLYRVTPVFSGENLLADGVLMEARSVEDPLVQFCAFCYNVQPGIAIDYATGESEGPAFTGTEKNDGTDSAKDPTKGISDREWDYIVNVHTCVFHLPSCDAAEKISSRNRQGFSGSREDLVEMGYRPCGRCRP